MKNRPWLRNLSFMPALGVSLLPKVACPACWPSYAGLLSALGLGFLVPNTAYLLPLTVVFLLGAVGALVFRARRRHGYGPFLVGVLSYPVILVGKFSLSNNLVFYAGLGLLILASAWNTWPTSVCLDCASAAGSSVNREARMEKL